MTGDETENLCIDRAFTVDEVGHSRRLEGGSDGSVGYDQLPSLASSPRPGKMEAVGILHLGSSGRLSSFEEVIE